MLKSVAIALAIGLVPFAASAQEKGMTAAGLYRMCSVTDPVWFGICYGYALAVADIYDSEGTMFCMLDEAENVVGAIRDDLHGKTDLHFLPAFQAVARTLDTHFRC